MNPTLRYILPVSYFISSRLNGLRALAALAVMEWLPNLLIIWWFTELPLWQVPLMAALSWGTFITVYELGYLMNDLFSVKFEDDPRRRSDAQPTTFSWIAWFAVRLIAFGAIVWHMGWFEQRHVWITYAMLAIVYTGHNLLRSSAPKILTFIGLATIRFLAPSLPLLAPEQLDQVLFPAFLNYVLFRTLTYIDSKGRLELPERKTMRFRVQFYAILLPVSVIASALGASLLPLAFTLYFLAFWLVAWAASSARRS